MVVVPIPTSKIWNQDIGTSQNRTACSRETVQRSIRRSAQAASAGVLYRAGPPVEAAPFLGTMRSNKIAARIVRVSVAPVLHQRLEFGIVPVRQHDAGGDEQIADSAGRLRQPLALEAKGPAARGILRYRQFDRAAQDRHANLAAEHRFIQRDRQIDAQIAAVDLEERMRHDTDRDQEIAGGMAGRGLALPFQPDLLSGGDAGGNLDIEFFAARQPDALLPALDRLFQRHRHGDVKVEIEGDSAGIELEGAAGAGPRAARRGAAEHAVEDVLETAA